jgi:DNA-binding transcriptional LysR family regulator
MTVLMWVTHERCSFSAPGLGVSLVPRMVQRGQGPVYLEIVAPSPSRTLHVAWREDSVLSPAAAALKSVALRRLQGFAANIQVR